MDTECPNCHADWRDTELVGNARSGGGYRCCCHICGHEWDDRHASHIERRERRAAGATRQEPT